MAPFFYLVQAAWPLLFTPSRASVFVLLAVISALTATPLLQVHEQSFRLTISAGVALLFLTLPVVTSFTNAPMSEMLLTLLVLRAVLSYARSLAAPLARHALWFGVWSALAHLTKATGVELALVPPLACLLGRRWALSLRLTFGLPALVVVDAAHARGAGGRAGAVAAIGGVGGTAAGPVGGVPEPDGGGVAAEAEGVPGRDAVLLESVRLGAGRADDAGAEGGAGSGAGPVSEGAGDELGVVPDGGRGAPVRRGGRVGGSSSCRGRLFGSWLGSTRRAAESKRLISSRFGNSKSSGLSPQIPWQHCHRISRRRWVLP